MFKKCKISPVALLPKFFDKPNYNFSESDEPTTQITYTTYTRRLWDVINMESAVTYYKEGGVTLEEAGKKYGIPHSSLQTR